MKRVREGFLGRRVSELAAPTARSSPGATTVGYGPRFLHSTGQLHKGGAPIGWFIQLVAGRPHDLEIPGSSFTFGQLVDAQALGDARSLVAHDLPILRIHLGSNPDAGLVAVESLFRRALSA